MGGISRMLKIQPLVSIVVPIYQVEKYIHECIDSILNQTYRNLEVILVDDGSPDACPQICEEYARKDERIILLHQRNQGQSVARNNGLDIVKGKYLAFVDSDDVVERDYILNAIDLMEKRKLDAVIIEASLMDESSNLIGERFHVFDSYSEVPATKALEMVITDQVGSQPWKAIYRSEVWKNVRFPEGKIYEDIGTTFKAYANMNGTVAFLPSKLYRYRLNSQGTSLSEGMMRKRVYHIFWNFREQNRYATVNCNEQIAMKCIANTASAASIVLSVYNSDQLEYKEANRYLRHNIRRILLNANISWKNRVKIFILILLPWLYRMIRKIRKAC